MSWTELLRAPLADLMVRDPVPSFARATAERILPALLACALAVALFVALSGIARTMLRLQGQPPVDGGPETDGLPADLAVGAGAGLLAIAAAAYVGLSLTGW